MRAILVAGLVVLGAAAEAKVVTQAVQYDHGGLALEGYLAYDDAAAGPRPGVLVIPEWWGLNEFAKTQARRLAELGYVAFAADMYGGGKVATDPAEAGQLAGALRGDTERWRGRAQAALDTLARQHRVDRGKLAAIGFCFGGTTVLHLAAAAPPAGGAGTTLAAVVSFHGSLPAFTAAEAGRIRARVLVLHGAADTHVPDEMVTKFMDSLRGTAADWQLVAYSGAKHSFMNPESDRMNAPGVGYDERTARRAWVQMQALFDETLGAK